MVLDIPYNKTAPVEGVKVPLLIQFPKRVIVNTEELKVAPELTVKLPATVALNKSVFAAAAPFENCRFP